MGIDHTSTSTTSFIYGDFSAMGNYHTYTTTSNLNYSHNGSGEDVCISTSTSGDTNRSRKAKRFGKGATEVEL